MKKRRNELVKRRKDKGWYQKDVVDHLYDNYNVSISESYYGMIEQGVRTPALNVALAIASLFEVDPNEIFFKVVPNEMLGVTERAKQVV